MDSAVAPIVVATDLSPGSGAALVAAHERGRRTGAPLLVCHVMADDSSRLSPLFPHQHQLFEDATELVAARRSVRAQVSAATQRSGADYDLHVSCGVPSAVIAQLAEDEGAALIVVGCGSKGLIARTILGSTTEQLAKMSPTSLLVVREGHGGDNVVAPTNLSGSHGRAIRVARDEAERRHSKVIVVSAEDPVTAATDQIASLIVIDDDSVDDDALDIVQRAPCSVLVLRGTAEF